MKILILGAAGQISKMLTNRLLQETEAELVLYARNANRRIANSEPSRITIIDGDFNDSAKLLEAMEGVAIVYLNDMNSPEATQTIVDASKKSGVAKIIGATILGIYDEVIGEFGEWNASMVGRTGTNRHKDSAKILEDSGIDYTLLRLTWLYNQEGNENIGQPKRRSFHRCASVPPSSCSSYHGHHWKSGYLFKQKPGRQRTQHRFSETILLLKIVFDFLGVQIL